MSFKRVENTKSIIRASAVSQAQFDLLQKIIAANAGEAKMTRKVLRVIVKDLTSREYAPYWIMKNLVTKCKEWGIYDLSKLHASTAVAKPAKSKSTKKENKPKRERKTAKLGAPARVPVEAAPALEAAPELDESHMIDSLAENVSE